MYENPDKIALALYFGSKTVTRDGEFIFKPFPTLQHIQHEAFVFAWTFNFLKVYDYKEGQYMPYSEQVEQGIRDNFIYNPIFDHYESKVEFDKEFDLWLQKNSKFGDEVKDIRNRCEKYNAQQLYLILYKDEKEYIKNIRRGDYHKYRNKISYILGSMRYDLIEGSKITEDKYNRLQEYFESVVR